MQQATVGLIGCGNFAFLQLFVFCIKKKKFLISSFDIDKKSESLTNFFWRKMFEFGIRNFPG